MTNFLEFSNGDRSAELADLFDESMGKESTSAERQEWIAYVNDVRVENWYFNVRPRGRITLIKKDIAVPELELVLETKELLVLNKPFGLPTQKTLKQNEFNLYDYTRLHYLIAKNFPKHFPYVGLHHRLDRDTSGLVLMTKMKSANKEVSELFKNRRIYKEYLAWTELGKKTPAKKWTETSRIARNYKNRKAFQFQVDSKGDEAVTEFELLETRPGFHLFRCYPKTGRTHQLRVHLSHLGWPILGDPIYGNRKLASRLMLHAQKLRFRFQNRDYELTSQIPQIDEQVGLKS